MKHALSPKKWFASMLAVAALALIAAGCTTQTSQQEATSNFSDNTEQLQILTSIPPLYSITANVAGAAAEVRNLLPAGASPHEYALTPGDIQRIASADVYVETGLGLEEFVGDAIANNAKDTAITVNASAQAATLNGEHHHHDEEGHDEDEHDHDEHEDEESHDDHDEEEHEDELTIDPHFWLSVDNAIAATKEIAEELAEADPTNASTYEANADAYIAELEELHEYGQSTLGSLTHKSFIPTHAAWLYFATEFNLEQVDAIEVTPGQEPSAQDVAGLIEAIEEHDVKAVFAEPQLETRVVDTLSSDANIPVFVIDPLGSGTLSKTLYSDTMRKNIDTFAEALQ